MVEEERLIPKIVSYLPSLGPSMAYFPLATKLFHLNLPFDGPAEFAAGNIWLIGREGTLMGGISVLPDTIEIQKYLEPC